MESENFYLQGDHLTINRWMYSGFELNDYVYSLFSKVRTINFDYYSKPLTKKIPSNVKKVTFECQIEYDICSFLPDELEELELLNTANFRVDNLPKKLRILTFGSSFNQPIDNLPDSVEEIFFFSIPEPYVFFNQPINNLPRNLKKLQLSEDFNHSLDNLPHSLELLILRYEFNKPVDFLPMNLKVLTIDGNFNQSIDNLPDSLEFLFFSPRIYDREISCLPNNLRILGWCVDGYDKNYRLPVNLDTFMYFSNYNTSHKELELPKNLRRLYIKDYDNKLILPDSLETLAIGYEYQHFNFFVNSIELKSNLFVLLPILPRRLPKKLKKLYLSCYIDIVDKNQEIFKIYMEDNPELEILYDEFLEIKF